jgi:excisionase family DNA binding protein
MYCTQNCARARSWMGLPAFGRSAAKRRERTLERAEQAGGFPAPGGGGRDVGRWGDYVIVTAGDGRGGGARRAQMQAANSSIDSGCMISPRRSCTSLGLLYHPTAKAPKNTRRRWDPKKTKGGEAGPQISESEFVPRAEPCRILGSNYKHEHPVSSSISSEDPILLTLSQAARRLSICRRTLERLIASGEFPQPIKIRGSSRVAVTDVEGYVARLMRIRAGGTSS